MEHDNHALQPTTSRTTQRDRIYRLLYEHRNQLVPLPTILSLGIAQFGARIKELRALGADIRNFRKTVNGSVHSSYVLVTDPAALPAEVSGGR